MSAIDQYHNMAGLALMAATNRLDGLDDARLREGRINLKLRIDFPNEAEREQIPASQLAKNPCSRFDLNELALLTLGASPAKLGSLVEQAAARGPVSQRNGRDRPQLEQVSWGPGCH